MCPADHPIGPSAVAATIFPGSKDNVGFKAQAVYLTVLGMAMMRAIGNAPGCPEHSQSVDYVLSGSGIFLPPELNTLTSGIQERQMVKASAGVKKPCDEGRQTIALPV
jgi:hypothetical protein